MTFNQVFLDYLFLYFYNKFCFLKGDIIMDILQTLDNELKNNHWSFDEKKRYLYIQSCKFFTYDTRFYFVNTAYGLRNIKNALNILKSINNKEIDLSNVTDNKVNCYSWSKAYKQMQNELLNTDAKVVENMFGDHAWVFFGHKADATEESDLSRVKMHLCTTGYDLSTESDKFIYDYQTPKKLKLMDKNIGYIKDNYCNLKELINFLKIEFQEQNIPKEEALFWWLYHLMDTYQHFQKNLLYFDDASFGISYLFEYFVAKEVCKTTKKITLFDDSNDDWDFIEIYKIPYLGDTFYYALLPCEEGYDFIEITSLDAFNYAISLKGPNKELLLKK